MEGLMLTYFNSHRDYSSWFDVNDMALVALFALVSITLSVMQVMPKMTKYRQKP